MIEILRERGAREVRSASTPADRARLWQGRKKAFGAMGRIAPDLAVQDAVVPRSALPDIMDRIEEIRSRHGLSISNVFHAGDGNLHPNISFDRRDPDLAGRVHLACREIMAACVAAGGSITGEHGVGSDKIDYMPLIFDADTLARHARGASGLRSRGAGQSRQGGAGPRLPRVAGDAGRRDERRRLRPPARAARHRRSGPRFRRAPPRDAGLGRRALAGVPTGARRGLEDPGRGTRHLAPCRRPGRSRGEHPRARSGALGESRRPGGHRPGGHADGGAAAAARRRRDVARPRSAGPAGAEPRLGAGDRHRRPAASWLRPGARSRARLHRRDRRRAAGTRRRAGGQERGRATTSPSCRWAASAGSASSPTCISGSGPCRAPMSP